MDAAPKSAEATEGPGAPPSEELVVRRRSPWPFLTVVIALFASAGGLVWYLTSRPDPFKVLVAVDVNGHWWEGSRDAAHVADEVAEGLKKIGFEAVKGGDPKVDKVLEKAKSPDEAARALGAGFVVVGEAKTELVEHPVEGGYVEVRAKVSLRVRYVLDDEGKADETAFSAWSGAANKKEAMRLLSDNLARRVFDAAVPRITDHPVIRDKLASKDVQALVRLDDAKKYVEGRRKQLDDVRKAYEALAGERDGASAKPFPITYLSRPSAKDYLCAAGPEGVLVQTQDSTPFVDPKTMKVGWITELETLAWRGDDGKDKTVWTGYHLYGYPSASPGGAPLVFVEDIFGWAKTITVALADGTSRRVAVDPEARFVNPEAAPGGAAAALYRRPCYGCKADFVVVSLTDGATLFSRASGGAFDGDDAAASFGGYAWLDDKRVIYVVEPSEVDTENWILQQVRVLDVSQTPPTDQKLLDLAPHERCQSPSSGEDGRRFVMTCSSESGGRLVVFDAQTGARTDTQLVGANADMSRDGSLVAYGRGGDIYLMKVADQSETRLTKNAIFERYPRISHDQRRVYFESQQEDPNEGRRVVSVIGFVGVP
jgi:hypothetical protein